MTFASAAVKSPRTCSFETAAESFAPLYFSRSPFSMPDRMASFIDEQSAPTSEESCASAPSTCADQLSCSCPTENSLIALATSTSCSMVAPALARIALKPCSFSGATRFARSSSDGSFSVAMRSAWTAAELSLANATTESRIAFGSGSSTFSSSSRLSMARTCAPTSPWHKPCSSSCL